MRLGGLASTVAVLSGLGLLTLYVGQRAEWFAAPIWAPFAIAAVFIVSLLIYLQSEYPLSQTQKEALHDMEHSPRLRRVILLSVLWLIVSGVLLGIGMATDSEMPYWLMIAGAILWIVMAVRSYGTLPRVWNGLTVMPTDRAYRFRRGLIAGAIAATVVLVALYAYMLILLRVAE